MVYTWAFCPIQVTNRKRSSSHSKLHTKGENVIWDTVARARLNVFLPLQTKLLWIILERGLLQWPGAGTSEREREKMDAKGKKKIKIILLFHLDHNIIQGTISDTAMAISDRRWRTARCSLSAPRVYILLLLILLWVCCVPCICITVFGHVFPYTSSTQAQLIILLVFIQ